ncbi:hypothetical protein Y032_0327g2602 [Ancylostoma ceylanicum]|uniref:Uncharacterized protein n=1 Tax=Ancylostoma ceylanicum TaxID=53326 RepID=A0A016RZR8_9BILA|nr:hypothetical protein Y032_0327g2602 [Ancylostoma ceylanicum]
MGCVAIHSHFLFGLLTIYVVIVIFLFTTGLYDLSPKPQSAYNYGVVTNEIDLEGFKVLTSIIVHTLCALCLVVSMMANNITRCAKVLPPIVIIIILFFNMIFNLAGCLCLWIHHAPNFPDGYANSIRGTAVCVAPIIHSVSLQGVECRASIHETLTMHSVIGYPIDHVRLRDAGRKSWSANLVSLGFAFMNPSPGWARIPKS